MIYGYARVSEQDQNLEIQRNALKEAGVPKRNIVVEKISSIVDPKRRPKLAKLLKKMKNGDQLVIWKLDRLGRNALDLLELDKQMSEKNLVLRSLTEDLDTGTAVGRFSYTVLAAVAEMERKLIAERVSAGMNEAKKHGKVFGRSWKLSSEDEIKLIEAYEAGIILPEIEKLFNVSKPTIYRYLRKNNKPLTRSRVREKIIS